MSDGHQPADDGDAAVVRAAVEAVRRGDSSAFAGIVARYERRLFGLCLMVTRDAAAAEELAQDAFVRAYVHLHTYDVRRPFYPWLSTIAVRLAQNHLAKARPRMHREAPDPDAALEVARSPEPDPLAGLIADETDRRIWQAVARLSSGERTSVILFYRQNMKVQDIARAIGVSDGTVKTLLFRARRKLRRSLGAGTSQEPRS